MIQLFDKMDFMDYGPLKKKKKDTNSMNQGCLFTNKVMLIFGVFPSANFPQEK